MAFMLVAKTSHPKLLVIQLTVLAVSSLSCIRLLRTPGRRFRTMLQILRTDATVADSTRPLIGVSWSVSS